MTSFLWRLFCDVQIHALQIMTLRDLHKIMKSVTKFWIRIKKDG